LGARSPSTDPLFSATGVTNGGGDTGSVLISPFITPGTVSDRFYNHYSWLRTMEDLFGVGQASPGLDGLGHLGYAAQPGLAPFGPDVFNNPEGNGNDDGQGDQTGHTSWAVPAAGILLVGFLPGARSWRRRRRTSAG